MGRRPSEPTRRLVLALYGLAGGLLLAGLARGRPDARGRNRIPLPLRMLSSAIVVVCALLLARDQGDRRDRAAPLVAAGMGCGFAGDLIMAELTGLPQHVLFGMLAFGAGHALYLRAFVLRARALGLSAARGSALGGAWAFALACWWALVRSPAVAAPLNYGALAYALLLCSMGGSAASLAAQERRYRPLALGGALFVTSDMLLARELFRDARFPGAGDLIWLTYIAGQALIVGAIGLDEQ